MRVGSDNVSYGDGLARKKAAPSLGWAVRFSFAHAS
jgi:hypothetical protein